MYTKKTKKTYIGWECTQRKIRPCEGALVTSLTLDDVRFTVPHGHEGICTEAGKVRVSIREKATSLAIQLVYLQQIFKNFKNMYV